MWCCGALPVAILRGDCGFGVAGWISGACLGCFSGVWRLWFCVLTCVWGLGFEWALCGLVWWLFVVAVGLLVCCGLCAFAGFSDLL